MGLFFNQGEVCAAGTRVLVHRSHYDDVVAALAGAAKAETLGDPCDPDTTMGALVNLERNPGQHRREGHHDRALTDAPGSTLTRCSGGRCGCSAHSSVRIRRRKGKNRSACRLTSLARFA
jgi:hypothetical protein